jgi:hypothetical protein
MLAIIAIHHPFSTAFYVPHRFWYVVFSFLFISRNLNFPSGFFNDALFERVFFSLPLFV